MLGINYNDFAFPLMFKMLDIRGISFCEERIELIIKCIDWILADREFIGEKCIGFLNPWGH